MKPSKITSRIGAILDSLDVAFQAIVNIHTGRCFGCEVLLRGHEANGYPSVSALLDFCNTVGQLAEAEMEVRCKGIAKLGRLSWGKELALFFNLDSRLLAEARAFHKSVRNEMGDHFNQLVTEISGGADNELTAGWVKSLKKNGSLIAADRFGAGNFSERLVHEADPDFIKIAPYFLADLDIDLRKRVLMSQIVNTAHTLGMRVIAVGVETQREFLACRELGCDLVQGFFVQRPVTDPNALEAVYPHLVQVVAEHQRRRTDQEWIADQLDRIPPVPVTESMAQVFERLAHDQGHTLIPVIDKRGQPLGILIERNLKNFVYSTYGKDLIANKSFGRSLQDFLVRCPVAEISSSLDQILATFSTSEDAEGIIITKTGAYVGFLSARSIIRALHEKTLARAREENPLSKLPGNDMINDYIAECLGSGLGAVLVYVDFDNFKPFNDTYGFRQGDRAILLFAELMRKAATGEDWFLGHIGGDDFFIGMRGCAPDLASEAIGRLISQFAVDAESFYDQSTRQQKCITAKDRDGVVRNFPLLSASAVLVGVPVGCQNCTVDDVSAVIAARKKESKQSPTKRVFAILPCKGPS